MQLNLILMQYLFVFVTETWYEVVCCCTVRVLLQFIIIQINKKT